MDMHLETGDRPAAFRQLRSELIEAHRPSDAHERFLVEEFAEAAWELRCARAVGREFWEHLAGHYSPGYTGIAEAQFQEKEARFRVHFRHRAEAERSYYRALNALNEAKRLCERSAPPERQESPRHTRRKPRARSAAAPAGPVDTALTAAPAPIAATEPGSRTAAPPPMAVADSAAQPAPTAAASRGINRPRLSTKRRQPANGAPARSRTGDDGDSLTLASIAELILAEFGTPAAAPARNPGPAAETPGVPGALGTRPKNGRYARIEVPESDPSI